MNFRKIRYKNELKSLLFSLVYKFPALIDISAILIILSYRHKLAGIPLLRFLSIAEAVDPLKCRELAR